MHKGRPTQAKRQRERAQAERRQQKAQRRQESKARRASMPDHDSGEDPDIAGIRPGPQPSAFGDLLDDGTTDVTSDE
jgi:hypothetical protein